MFHLLYNLYQYVKLRTERRVCLVRASLCCKTTLFIHS